MAFIRIKKLKGKEYAYLVANEWTSNGSRQRVKAYLGRIIKPERHKEESVDISSMGFQDAVLALVKQEIANHDLDENINADVGSNKFTKSKRNIVIALNEGFLCEHTLTDVLSFKSEGHEEKVGTELATVLVEAGLKLPKDVFVELFQKIFKLNENMV